MNNHRPTAFQLFCFTLVVCALLLALLAASGAGAAPAQAPYLNDCINGICTVYWPGVTGYDSGYLEVFNTCTQETGALYLTWQPTHPLDMGEYHNDIRQMFLMGPCDAYLVTDGHLGYQNIYIPTGEDVFSFAMWRNWLAVMR